MRRLVRDLQRQFPQAVIGRTKGSHIRLTFAGGITAVLPSTPSDLRSLKNAAADIRRRLRTGDAR